MTQAFTRTLRRFASLAALAASTLLAAAPAAAQPVVIGEGLSIGWSQFFVADAEKLWEQQGLQPTAITFPSGRLVLDAVIGGRVLIGTAAETPVVFAALNGLPVRILATLNNGGGKPYEPFTLVASTDIKKIADIKGKRIGYSQGTNAHLYLSRLLDSVGLKFSDINAISLTPTDFVSGAVSGTLDGFIWTEPFVSQALAQGKGKLHSLPSPGLYRGTSTVITLQSTVEKEPELLRKALRALAASDAFIKSNPDKAIQTVATRVNFDLALARPYWPTLNLGLGLDKKALVAELEAQAKWAIANNLVRPDAKIPDFNTIVVGDFLPTAAR